MSVGSWQPGMTLWGSVRGHCYSGQDLNSPFANQINKYYAEELWTLYTKEVGERDKTKQNTFNFLYRNYVKLSENLIFLQERYL